MGTTTKPQILLIEDNTVVARMVQAILDREGFEVHWYVDGDQALGGIQRIAPELVLCDLVLPSIDGFEVLRRLQHNPALAHVPFVLISSRSDALTVRRGMNLGADDYLAKPFRPDELVSAVRSRIRRRQVAERRHREDRLLDEQNRLVREAFDARTNLPREALLLEHLREARDRATAVRLLLVQLQSTERLRALLGETGFEELRAHVAGTLRHRGRIYTGHEAEFFLLDEMVDGVGHEARAAELLEAARGPLQTAAGTVHLVAFCGVVLPVATLDPLEALRAARLAVLEAQDSSVAYHVFTADTPKRMLDEVRIESEFGVALTKGQLELLYQPQVQMDTGQVMGAEALVRWRRPEGLLPPGRWVPTLERCGLISPLTQWVLRTACGSFAASPVLSQSRIRLAVNVSGPELDDETFVEQVRRTLADTGWPADLLEIEITEGAAMRNPDLANRTMRQLTELGVTIAIDDFGTGYSSLAYLKRLPVHSLKIDRAFVRELPEDAASTVIVRNIVHLAEALGLGILAEGVENQEQRELLLREGCHHAQGFLFGHPQSLAELETMIA